MGNSMGVDVTEITVYYNIIVVHLAMKFDGKLMGVPRDHKCPPLDLEFWLPRPILTHGATQGCGLTSLHS